MLSILLEESFVIQKISQGFYFPEEIIMIGVSSCINDILDKIIEVNDAIFDNLHDALHGISSVKHCYVKTGNFMQSPYFYYNL